MLSNGGKNSKNIWPNLMKIRTNDRKASVLDESFGRSLKKISQKKLSLHCCEQQMPPAVYAEDVAQYCWVKGLQQGYKGVKNIEKTIFKVIILFLSHKCLSSYCCFYVKLLLDHNVRSVKKHTKHSSNTLLCLVCFFTEWTLNWLECMPGVQNG